MAFESLVESPEQKSGGDTFAAFRELAGGPLSSVFKKMAGDTSAASAGLPGCEVGAACMGTGMLMGGGETPNFSAVANMVDASALKAPSFG